MNRKLILGKEIKSPVEIRYKTHYFPQSGENAGRPQTPRYLHTVDDQQEIVIKVYYIHSKKNTYFTEPLKKVPQIS